MWAQPLGNRLEEWACELQIVAFGVARIGRIDTEDEHRSRFVRSIRRAAMDRQRRPDGDVAHARHLLLRTAFVPRVERFRWKHLVLEALGDIPLRAGSDLEGAHVLRDIDRRDVEGERIEAPAHERRLRRGKVAVPGLQHRAGKRNVEPDLDNFMLRSEHRAADGDNPGMRDEIHESTNALRMDLRVIPLWAAPYESAGPVQPFREELIDVFTEGLRPFPREGSLEPDDAITVEAAHDRGRIVLGRRVRRGRVCADRRAHEALLRTLKWNVVRD